MRATKAKALRRALGFKPHAPREFSHGRRIEKKLINDRPTRYVVITSTVTATGARRQYQAAKRHGMTTAALGFVRKNAKTYQTIGDTALAVKVEPSRTTTTD